MLLRAPAQNSTQPVPARERAAAMSAAGDAPGPVPKVNGAFASPLTCSDDLWRITKLWDGSGSGVRAALLASFLGRFDGQPAVDLEAGLVGGASLLLARFVAALRLSGSHFRGGGVAGFCSPLSPLLAALRVFLRAQQCHRFAAEALEAGALDALLATLRRSRLRAAHADAVLRTLSLLLAAGRRFKEAFIVGDGLRVLCELLGRRQVSTPAVADRVDRLLMQLHEGNPRTVDQLAEFMCQLTESTETQAQLVACRLLTAVLPRAPAHQRPAVAPLLALLRHPDVSLHVEVAEALRVLLATPARNDVVRGLVALLLPTGAISADHPLYETEPSLSALYDLPAAHVFCQQAAAVRVADLLSAGCPAALTALLSGDLCGGLLVALSTTPHPESQTEAARLLRRLLSRHEVRARLETTLTAAQMAQLRQDDRRFATELSVAEAARIRREAGFSYDWDGTGPLGEEEGDGQGRLDGLHAGLGKEGGADRVAVENGGAPEMEGTGKNGKTESKD